MSQLRYRAASIQMSLLPFCGRRVANRLFSDVANPLVLKRTFGGLWLYLDVSRSIYHQLLYLEGERLVHERHLLRRLVSPGMRVVDVGANIGYYTLMFHRLVGPSGEVICIEPSPENLEELRRNVDGNHLANARIISCAVGETPGRVGFKAGINGGVVRDGEGAYTADVQTLDSLVAERVDFVKIDVDGYEGHVLKGARELLARDRPILFLEFHPELVGRHGTSFDEVLELLSGVYSSIEFFETCRRGWGCCRRLPYGIGGGTPSEMSTFGGRRRRGSTRGGCSGRSGSSAADV